MPYEKDTKEMDPPNISQTKGDQYLLIDHVGRTERLGGRCREKERFSKSNEWLSTITPYA